ncbi:hypothetical protein DB88DRAFT_528838 [Papiliotrema laurentii]|uniref:Uncharacterized protein n=1 Tax=Papiliotrema laurentii TaxID=5418 RepID=A0AAD9CZS8_PAPLA|nr:hypothetical protein DB88DRAFT_528838 [Papiliotrema laurentii]
MTYPRNFVVGFDPSDFDSYKAAGFIVNHPPWGDPVLTLQNGLKPCRVYTLHGTSKADGTLEKQKFVYICASARETQGMSESQRAIDATEDSEVTDRVGPSLPRFRQDVVIENAEGDKMDAELINPSDMDTLPESERPYNLLTFDESTFVQPVSAGGFRARAIISPTTILLHKSGSSFFCKEELPWAEQASPGSLEHSLEPISYTFFHVLDHSRSNTEVPHSGPFHKGLKSASPDTHHSREEGGEGATSGGRPGQ